MLAGKSSVDVPIERVDFDNESIESPIDSHASDKSLLELLIERVDTGVERAKRCTPYCVCDCRSRNAGSSDKAEPTPVEFIEPTADSRWTTVRLKPTRRCPGAA